MAVGNSTSSCQSSGGVKWRRFAFAAVPAIATASVLTGLTARGAIASSVSVSGGEYMITAQQVVGHGFVQFGGQVPVNQGGRQIQKPVIVSGMASAAITRLCQSVSVGPVRMRLTAGDAGTPVSATNLIVDASGQTSGLATLHTVTTGQDASTLTEDGTVTGATGGFGQQASSVTISNLSEKTWMVTAGTFTLPHMSLRLGGKC